MEVSTVADTPAPSLTATHLHNWGAIKFRGQKLNRVLVHAVAFFGDGTCNIGQFYECLNMAALWKLPMIFVVENNLWAIGMNHFRSTSVPEIYQKGPAFGVPGVHVDGMDVLAVRGVAMEAIARARRGDGPTLIEAETYRFRGHSLADPDELRDPGKQCLVLLHLKDSVLERTT